MKTKLNLGTYFDIPIEIHIGTLVIVALVTAFTSGYSLIGNISMGIIKSIVLLGIILIHEYGHALMGQRYGIITYKIQLIISGGVAYMENPLPNFKRDVNIAFAGPLTNIFLSIITIAMLVFLKGVSITLPLPLLDIVIWFAVVNIVIGLFNLFPILPLDGGRIIQSFFRMKYSEKKASRYGFYVGVISGIILFSIGIAIKDIILCIFSPIFIWYAWKSQ